jgi:MFS transporter, ACDE family, multidrug resistance protein
LRAPISQLFGRISGQRAHAFVVLFVLDATFRALLITIVPQRLYGILGDATRVTLLYFAASFCGLAVNLAMPRLLHRFGRTRVLEVATIFAVLSCTLFAIGTPSAAMLALMLNIAIGATLEVLINVAMLETVARRELNHFEPKRLLYVGATFVAGPWLGVVIDTRIAHNLTFVLAGIVSVVLFLTFRAVGVGTPIALAPGAEPPEPPNPLNMIPRFAAQPRLVLAWLLAIGRNGWWTMYFVYTPILVASFGRSAETAGALISLGMLPMFLIHFWASFGHRHGIRVLLTWAYAATGMATLAIGLTAHWPTVSLGCLLIASAAATSIDGAGNVPFLRAVRPLERAAMTSVYMTFRHVASILLPAIFALLLQVGPLPVVFLAGGVIALLMAALARYLPKGL